MILRGSLYLENKEGGRGSSLINWSPVYAQDKRLQWTWLQDLINDKINIYLPRSKWTQTNCTTIDNCDIIIRNNNTNNGKYEGQLAILIAILSASNCHLSASNCS